MNITKELQQILTAAVTEQEIPGAVLYLADANNNWELAAGVANLKTRQQMRPRDRFRIGSVSKVFVAAAVLQLVEAEAITLEDTISDWLDSSIAERLPNSEVITLRQMLNHTSGLTDYLETDGFNEAADESPMTKIWTPQEAIAYIYDSEPLFQPGKKHSYSNSNYILIELIVEAVTGNILAKELRSRFFDPLDLKDTFTEMREPIPGGFVEGYGDLDGDGKAEPTSKYNCGLGLGDGGLVSSSRDVAKFARTLFATEELLSSETLASMRDWVDDGEGNRYGLGLSGWDSDWGEAWGHGGSVDGFLSTLWYLPAQEVVAVVLANDSDRAYPDSIAQSALELYFG